MDLEKCIGRVKLKRINGDAWIIIKNDRECYGCGYRGEVRINYCRSRKVYFGYLDEDNKQLSLPFKEMERLS
jgi:hypothetical protein